MIFSCEFCQFFKDSDLVEHLKTTASEFGAKVLTKVRSELKQSKTT